MDTKGLSSCAPLDMGEPFPCVSPVSKKGFSSLVVEKEQGRRML